MSHTSVCFAQLNLSITCHLFLGSQLEDPDSMMEFYVVLRSIERYYSEFKEYPGDLDDRVEPDIVTLKVSNCDLLRTRSEAFHILLFCARISSQTCVSKLLSEMGCSSVIKDELIHEFCRYGGAELHSISAFMGMCLIELSQQFAKYDQS